jgi:transposase
MRYELTDFEWAAIQSLLPNKPRGIPCVDDRRVLNGIFWSCVQALPGGICHKHMVPATLATIVSFVGVRLAYGTGSWMRWPAVMTRRCR